MGKDTHLALLTPRETALYAAQGGPCSPLV